MKKKVIVAGHICLDLTPAFPEHAVASADQFLKPGSMLQIGAADVHTGGAVANTGLAMKLLGADVSLMGKIGTDAFGDLVWKILEQYDTTDGMIRSTSETTSYTIVLAVPGIDRMFLHHTGANDTFSTADVSIDKVKEAALFHFGYPQTLKKMYENDGAELIKLFQMVRDCGTATSLDLTMPDAASEAGKLNWYNILSKVLPLIDFFVPSVEELCFMLDRERYAEWKQRAAGGERTDILDVERDIRPLAEQSLALGCKVILLKCGRQGMYLMTANEQKLSEISDSVGLDAKQWADIAFFEKSYQPERVLSATGAGDTSIAAFLTSMLSGKTPERCLQLAAATGACCVAAYDALSGLKSLEELEWKIESGWEKVKNENVRA